MGQNHIQDAYDYVQGNELANGANSVQEFITGV